MEKIIFIFINKINFQILYLHTIFKMKIALLGHGKTGKEIEKIAVEKGHEIVLIVTSGNKKIFQKMI